MATPAVLANPSEIPLGAHALTLHAGPTEAADHVASFLEGAPDSQAARFWVPDGSSAALLAEVVEKRSPAHVGCIAILTTEQVEPTDGKLRPVATIRAYIGEHPEGVTAGAGTISSYLTEENAAAHAEYEAWFDRQSRENCRFACPYDLRSIPVEAGPELLRELGAHHSHVVLSHSDEPGALLLELFLFDRPSEMPEELRETLRWALDRQLVTDGGSDVPLALTAAGEAVVRDWGSRSTVDY